MGRCELTGKGPVVKNLVSHSNIKTKSTAASNVQRKRLFSKVLNQMVSLKVATSTIKAMEHQGGFDQYILGLDSKTLSPKAMTVRKNIRMKLKQKKA